MTQELQKSSKKINSDLAKLLARVAQIAYTPKEREISHQNFHKEILSELYKEMSPLNFNPIKVFTTNRGAEESWLKSIVDFNPEKEEVYIGFMAKGEFLTRECILVGFRGSTSMPGDWIDGNFKFLAEENPIVAVNNGSLHKGFHGFFKYFAKDVAATVFPWLMNYYKRDNSLPLLLITGHSLGAALATLTTVYLKEQWEAYLKESTEYNVKVALHKTKKTIQPIIYTFGSPRVGDRKFAKYFNQLIGYYDSPLKTYSSIRFTAKFDIVPSLPKARSFHVNQGVFLTPWEVGDTWVGALPSVGVKANHKIENYLSLIEAYIKKNKSWEFLPSEAESKAPLDYFSFAQGLGESSLNSNLHQPFGDTPMALDGEQVIFDKPVPTTPVALEPKPDRRRAYTNGNGYRPY